MMSRLAPFLTLAFAIGASPALLAQETKVKVDLNKIEVIAQKTPEFDVGSGIREAKAERKDWFQIEVEFSADSSNTRENFVGGLEFRYFVLPSSAERQQKKVYTATLSHVDIPKGENLRSAVYLSPNSLSRIYEGRAPNPRDLWVAVEVYYGGTLIAGDVTDGKSSRWWQNPEAPKDAATLRPKNRTPFADLWLDAFADIAGE